MGEGEEVGIVWIRGAIDPWEETEAVEGDLHPLFGEGLGLL
jgi:hypothetical protein